MVAPTFAVGSTIEDVGEGLGAVDENGEKTGAEFGGFCG